MGWERALASKGFENIKICTCLGWDEKTDLSIRDAGKT